MPRAYSEDETMAARRASSATKPPPRHRTPLAPKLGPNHPPSSASTARPARTAAHKAKSEERKPRVRASAATPPPRGVRTAPKPGAPTSCKTPTHGGGGAREEELYAAAAAVGVAAAMRAVRRNGQVQARDAAALTPRVTAYLSAPVEEALRVPESAQAGGAAPSPCTPASAQESPGSEGSLTSLRVALVKAADPASPAPADHEADAHALTACSAKLEELMILKARVQKKADKLAAGSSPSKEHQVGTVFQGRPRAELLGIKSQVAEAIIHLYGECQRLQRRVEARRTQLVEEHAHSDGSPPLPAPALPAARPGVAALVVSPTAAPWTDHESPFDATPEAPAKEAEQPPMVPLSASSAGSASFGSSVGTTLEATATQAKVAAAPPALLSQTLERRRLDSWRQQLLALEEEHQTQLDQLSQLQQKLSLAESSPGLHATLTTPLPTDVEADSGHLDVADVTAGASVKAPTPSPTTSTPEAGLPSLPTPSPLIPIDEYLAITSPFPGNLPSPDALYEAAIAAHSAVEATESLQSALQQEGMGASPADTSPGPGQLDITVDLSPSPASLSRGFESADVEGTEPRSIKEEQLPTDSGILDAQLIHELGERRPLSNQGHTAANMWNEPSVGPGLEDWSDEMSVVHETSGACDFEFSADSLPNPLSPAGNPARLLSFADEPTAILKTAGLPLLEGRECSTLSTGWESLLGETSATPCQDPTRNQRQSLVQNLASNQLELPHEMGPSMRSDERPPCLPTPAQISPSIPGQRSEAMSAPSQTDSFTSILFTRSATAEAVPATQSCIAATRTLDPELDGNELGTPANPPAQPHTPLMYTVPPPTGDLARASRSTVASLHDPSTGGSVNSHNICNASGRRFTQQHVQDPPKRSVPGQVNRSPAEASDQSRSTWSNSSHYQARKTSQDRSSMSACSTSRLQKQHQVTASADISPVTKSRITKSREVAVFGSGVLQTTSCNGSEQLEQVVVVCDGSGHWRRVVMAEEKLAVATPDCTTSLPGEISGKSQDVCTACEGLQPAEAQQTQHKHPKASRSSQTQQRAPKSLRLEDSRPAQALMVSDPFSQEVGCTVVETLNVQPVAEHEFRSTHGAAPEDHNATGVEVMAPASSLGSDAASEICEMCAMEAQEAEAAPVPPEYLEAEPGLDDRTHQQEQSLKDCTNNHQGAPGHTNLTQEAPTSLASSIPVAIGTPPVVSKVGHALVMHQEPHTAIPDAEALADSLVMPRGEDGSQQMPADHIQEISVRSKDCVPRDTTSVDPENSHKKRTTVDRASPKVLQVSPRHSKSTEGCPMPEQVEAETYPLIAAENRTLHKALLQKTAECYEYQLLVSAVQEEYVGLVYRHKKEQLAYMATQTKGKHKRKDNTHSRWRIHDSLDPDRLLERHRKQHLERMRLHTEMVDPEQPVASMQPASVLRRDSALSQQPPSIPEPPHTCKGGDAHETSDFASLADVDSAKLLVGQQRLSPNAKVCCWLQEMPSPSKMRPYTGPATPAPPSPPPTALQSPGMLQTPSTQLLSRGASLLLGTPLLHAPPLSFPNEASHLPSSSIGLPCTHSPLQAPGVTSPLSSHLRPEATPVHTQPQVQSRSVRNVRPPSPRLHASLSPTAPISPVLNEQQPASNASGRVRSDDLQELNLQGMLVPGSSSQSYAVPHSTTQQQLAQSTVQTLARLLSSSDPTSRQLAAQLEEVHKLKAQEQAEQQRQLDLVAQTARHHQMYCEMSNTRLDTAQDTFTHSRPSKSQHMATRNMPRAPTDYALEHNVQLVGGDLPWEDEELQRDVEKLVTLQQRQLMLQKQQIDRQMQSYLTERLEIMGTPSQGTPSSQERSPYRACSPIPMHPQVPAVPQS